MLMNLLPGLQSLHVQSLYMYICTSNASLIDLIANLTVTMYMYIKHLLGYLHPWI